MIFHVGPFRYTAVVSDRSIFDEECNEQEGRAVENRRLIILSHIVHPDRREEVLYHEIRHAWLFHVPPPANEEQEAQLGAMIREAFNRDLEQQGGREALAQLPPVRIPHLGKPPAGEPTAGEHSRIEPTPMGGHDRVQCPACEADVMCGSIHNGMPDFHQPTRSWRLQRWMLCDACNCVQVWLELCSEDGLPLSQYVSNPPPRVLRGPEARRWMAEHAPVLNAG
jgi:hypothetical protein